jgi:hypothetical protein
MRTLILILLMLAIGNGSLQAQIGNQRFGRSAIPQAETPPKEPEPKTAEELVAEHMPDITEALELNDFETAVVNAILTKYVQQRIELQILKLEPDQTRAALEKISQEEEEEFRQGLPEDKYEALMILRENRYNTNKVNKKKKKKKKKKKTKT